MDHKGTDCDVHWCKCYFFRKLIIINKTCELGKTGMEKYGLRAKAFVSSSEFVAPSGVLLNGDDGL